MSLFIRGIGTAVPDGRILQRDAAEIVAGFTEATPEHGRLIRMLYGQTKIRSRGSVLLEDAGPEGCRQRFFGPASAGAPGGPATSTRMDRYATEAGPLAVAAASRALAAAGLAARDVTHLVTCSCTGFTSPGFDLDLVAAIGLPATVARTHVGFMGCHGAFNALRVADAFVAGRPASVPLVVCVELCSLHFQYGTRSDVVVANGLFADGAAALAGTGPRVPESAGSGWRIERQWSEILSGSRDEMGWRVGDHGFEMSLAATVPATIARHVPAALAAGLAGAGLTAADIGAWAVHPGGPRVLTAVAEALGLEDRALDASREVLAEHGNMSSATILFILERLLREPGAGPCVAMAFGPGLTAEFALLARP